MTDHKAIAQMIATERGVSVDMLCGPGKQQPLARYRQEAMWVSRHAGEQSFTQIGGYYGGRDHTTAMHAVKRISQFMAQDPAYSQEMTRMSERVRALYRPVFIRSETINPPFRSRRGKGSLK